VLDYNVGEVPHKLQICINRFDIYIFAMLQLYNVGTL
jgi:hypothetical protein